ncbi:MAG TPA: type II secretion system F family protein [Nocardioidaceae bacterium]
MSAWGAAPTFLAAGGAAAAVALTMARPRSSSAGLETWVARGPRVGTDGVPVREAEEDLVGRHRTAVSLLAGAAPLALLGGVAGALGAVVVVVVVHRALGTREPAGERRRREQVARSLPHVVDLIAVTLSSGASPTRALAAVANAVDGPMAAELRAVERSLALGRDPSTVWREVAQRPGLAALGRAMARAVESGASVSDSLHQLAQDLHASARLEADSRARAVGVRAAAPLGLCLLPAFVLLGVVPLVAGTVTVLLAP